MTYSQLHSGQNVLDLGCGTGLVAIKAKRIVGSEGRVVGVDVSHAMLAKARRKARRADLDIVFSPTRHQQP
jgi:ubiquinone/menaquinone biosynthesis C-methylase UbiE